ncbi:39S ribosomal protein L44, mitochondrial [Asbolus verrucosus]|uniref:Large ribosomal subunit protein mL44 n=1 Tax=Asbolus verrucosus TaxID=1661398 RepID=A0A482W6T1_ASBVE|nr:39S ribosomal protein L44, mitochondrial [Asbolus verrucosus]
MALYRQTAVTVGRVVLRNFNNPKIKEIRSIKRWVAPTLNELYRRRLKAGPEPLKPRSTYLEWNYEAEVFAFGKRLGEEFDQKTLKQALTHRSYVNLERDKAKERGAESFEEISSNQHLIKEGEAIISDYLREELNRLHLEVVAKALYDYLTTEEMLAHVARYMGLKDIVLTAEFPVADSTLADSFKAVVAALTMSQDLKRAQLFVKDFLLSQLTGKDIYDIWNPDKPLEYLKSLLQQKGIDEIEPRLCNQSATNTILANYQVGLYNNRKLLGIGWGESIEIAKETAALDAIQRIHNEK